MNIINKYIFPESYNTLGRIPLIFVAMTGIIYFIIYTVYEEEIERRFTTQEYIAHGGGAIDGYPATNSLEAVTRSIENNILYIELDIRPTSDSILVATHDWESFSKMSGISASEGNPPSYDDFRRAKLLGKYTPLTYKMIDSIFMKKPELKLVTDKTDDIDFLLQFLPRLANRLMVECFSSETYNKCVESKSCIPMHSYLNFSFGDLNVTALGSDRHKLLRFIPSLYSLFSTDGMTRSRADSIFSTDRRVKFIYIDDTNQ